MYWILQNNICNDARWEGVVDTLTRFGIKHSVHKIIPFVGELLDPPIIDHKNVICMGAYSLRYYAKKNGYTPGVFDLEPYDFTKQLQHWGGHMLNSRSIVTTMGDAAPSDQEFFCRPILDSKSFSGQVFRIDDFIAWKKNVVDLGFDYGTTVDGNTLIQIAPLIKIQAEYRFFIVAGRISTATMYKLGRTLLYRNFDQPFSFHIHDFVEQRIREFNPLGSMCIDIAETEEGLKVIEINTINSSGFYAADVQKLVFDLEDAYTT